MGKIEGWKTINDQKWVNENNGNVIEIRKDYKTNHGWYIRRFDSEGNNIGMPILHAHGVDIYKDYIKDTKKGARKSAIQYMRNMDYYHNKIDDQTQRKGFT